MSKIINAIVIAFIIASGSANAAGNPVQDCVNKMVWKSVGVSALYGGGLMALGSTLAVATSPVSLPLATGVAIVASNAIVGGALGAGSSAVTITYQEAKMKVSPLVAACTIEVTANAVNLTKQTTARIAKQAANAANQIAEGAENASIQMRGVQVNTRIYAKKAIAEYF